MAKKKSPKTRTVTKTVRSRRSGGSKKGGIIWNAGSGAVAGALSKILGNQLNTKSGNFSVAVPALAVGYVAGNDALETVGGFELGKILASGVGTTGTTTGGGY